jgi:hypothetical protein
MAGKDLIKGRKRAEPRSKGNLAAPPLPPLCTHLALSRSRLQYAHALVLTAAIALQQQNAEADRDISTVLQHSVAIFYAAR